MELRGLCWVHHEAQRSRYMGNGGGVGLRWEEGVPGPQATRSHHSAQVLWGPGAFSPSCRGTARGWGTGRNQVQGQAAVRSLATPFPGALPQRSCQGRGGWEWGLWCCALMVSHHQLLSLIRSSAPLPSFLRPSAHHPSIYCPSVWSLLQGPTVPGSLCPDGRAEAGACYHCLAEGSGGQRRPAAPALRRAGSPFLLGAGGMA